MRANNTPYNFNKSMKRIDLMLSSIEDNAFAEMDVIPKKSELTSTNGFYVNCCALFIDMRKSSQLTSSYRKKTLSKIYRVFLSECVAVINANRFCTEIMITGDCVSGIFKGDKQETVDDVFITSMKLVSLIERINTKFKEKAIGSISVGIGMTCGVALMVRAGFGGLNGIVWMGDVVNQASNLCSDANKISNIETQVLDEVFYLNLSDRYKEKLKSFPCEHKYHGTVSIEDIVSQ